MNRSHIVIGVLAAVSLSSCHSSKVRISGRFVGCDAKKVYIEQVSTARVVAVDSTELDAEGNFRFELQGVGRTPSLYNIGYNGETVPVLLEGGDRLRVEAVGSVARNYTVEGNDESELLSRFNKAYVEGAARLRAIGREYAQASGEKQKELGKAYSDEYLRIKRAQLQFIVENKGSVAAVYALYQRLPGDDYLFNGQSDLVYYRTVAEALEESHPESPYLTSLHADIAQLEALRSLASQVTEATYPDIELPNIYGEKKRLSSLHGKVVLLDFWAPSQAAANARNAELKTVYGKYAARGFEIYQVAVAASRPAWVTAVQDQSLPWISVSDLKGTGSSVLSLYNVRRLPAGYLIDREGNIAGKDLEGDALERRIAELL